MTVFEIDPMYFWLQEHESLSRVKLPYGDEGWLLVRYEDWRSGSLVNCSRRW
jgi:hypothetical protein